MLINLITDRLKKLKLFFYIPPIIKGLLTNHVVFILREMVAH